MTEEKTDKFMKIAGVRFRENWKVYDFDATDAEVTIGDRVIVDSDRGLGFASVVRIRRAEKPAPSDSPTVPLPQPEIQEGIEIEIDSLEESPPPANSGKGQGATVTRKILRKATEDDIVKEEKNRGREAEAFSTAQDMIAERDLPMKLIRVEYSFDASRATFFFFSENRIDFRELVKDLAYKLKSRIEMRQIGVRDVARMIGGFGPCGRELCCSSFLKNFEPVSIRMAKKQEMVLNPAKISGVCGRLLCCLSYEYEMYDANKKDLADMRQSAVKEKKEEDERRIAEERKLAEEERTAAEKRRQEDRKQQQDQRRDKPKEVVLKGGGRPDKRKDQQEKKAQPRQPEQGRRQRQQQQQQQKQQQKQPQKQPQPKPEKEQIQDQKTVEHVQEQKEQQQLQQQPQSPLQQDGEKSAKKKRRRFWRKKKKPGQGQGESKPQGGPSGPPSEG